MRESNRPMGKATDGGCEFDLRGTYNGHSLKYPGRVLFNMWSLGSETRDEACMRTERKDRYGSRVDTLGR